MLHGYIILCPITAKQMLDDRVLACKKIQRALKLAEKISLKIIGLGAYTSSVTDGGRDIVGKYKLAITNGNARTSAVAIKDIAKIVKCVFKGNFSEPEIAVVGATGSIGSAVSKMIAAYKPRSLILVGRNAENLNELKSDIKSFQKIFATTKIQNIKTADLIVVATSAKGAILKPDYLKKGAIVYDITQPRNVAKILCEQRPDILVLDGGLVKTENISYQFNFYLPKDTIFACLAEVMILTLKKQFIDFSIGKVSLDKVEKINKMVQDIGFESPAFYSFGKRVSLRR
ncbi:polysaccharide biosynthesis protein [Candidatus Parcubacteria bacterium]|nr:polysaccharide biosynthesis protein [Candidatus Parcubacteria bacterium]